MSQSMNECSGCRFWPAASNDLDAARCAKVDVTEVAENNVQQEIQHAKDMNVRPML